MATWSMSSQTLCQRADLKVDTFHRARGKDLLAAVPRSSLMQRLIKVPDTGQ